MTPTLVAHRGAALWAPENTIAAARLAVEMGARMIELDVRESADGVLYVLHDETVDRTSDGQGALHLMSSVEIDALDAGRWFAPGFEGQRIPRLDAYLDMLRGLGAGAFVEVKWASPDKVACIVRDAALPDAILWSPSAILRDALRAAAPDLPHLVRAREARNVSMARDLFGGSVFEVIPEEMRAAVISAARAAGMPTMCYSEGAQPALFRAMIDLGIDYINHDHLEVTTNLLRHSA